MDVWEMDIRRFGPHYRSPSYTLKRAKEVYETYYDIRYPGHEREAGRPLRTSSAYPWHAEHGAAFGEKSGWERVNWYESNAPAGDESLRPRGWAGMHWSAAIGAEHRATRERVAVFALLGRVREQVAPLRRLERQRRGDVGCLKRRQVALHIDDDARASFGIDQVCGLSANLDALGRAAPDGLAPETR